MTYWTDAGGHVYARLATGELIGPYADRSALWADTTETERENVTRGDGWGS